MSERGRRILTILNRATAEAYKHDVSIISQKHLSTFDCNGWKHEMSSVDLRADGTLLLHWLSKDGVDWIDNFWEGTEAEWHSWLEGGGSKE